TDRFNDALAYLRERNLPIPVGAVLSDGGQVRLQLQPAEEQARSVQGIAEQAPRAGEGDPEAARQAARDLASAVSEFRLSLDWGNGSEAPAFARMRCHWEAWQQSRGIFYFTTAQRQTLAKLDEELAFLSEAYLSRRAANARELAQYLWQVTAETPTVAGDDTARGDLRDLAAGCAQDPPKMEELRALRQRWAASRSALPLGPAYAELEERLDRELTTLEVAAGLTEVTPPSASPGLP
ncbi:MAG: hypothetical protein AB1758_34510, partial [Candidatus Eremiobacterota bacterium]